MPNEVAKERAAMPPGTNKLLDERTIEENNRNLLKLLRKNMSVLDAGCGSGALTNGIATIVAPGKVAGIDSSDELILLAKEKYQHVKNLSFDVVDIYSYHPGEQFDLISSARVLQWLDRPVQALANMKKLLTEKGCISILDYNHEKIKWYPAIPASMDFFYRAFLQWRADAGFDNAVADHLENMFRKIGFSKITVEDQSEKTEKSDPHFSTKARIWSVVAETRGRQLVKDNYISDAQRLAAIKDYDEWIAGDGEMMQMYLLAVTASL